MIVRPEDASGPRPGRTVGCTGVSSQANAETRMPLKARSSLRSLVRGEMGMIAGAGIWALLVVNFSALYLTGGDSQVQFTFVQRLFGDARTADGYFFGLALAEAPFYAAGKLLGYCGLHSVSGKPVEQTTVALGLGLITVAAWPLLQSVCRGLRLRHGAFAILAAGLGTPLFYYATFVPGKDHALDALLFSAAIYLAYRYFSAARVEPWLPYAIGAVFGFSCTVRYFNGAEAVAFVLVLVYWRRWRDAITVGATSAVVCLALFLIPILYSASVFSGGPATENTLTFAPLNPLRMLFTDHRGYFVWSPIGALGALGYIVLFRRRPDDRRFLVAVVAMALAVMSSYALIPFWDGTWAFGQRFYTPLFPVVAIGLAGLLEATPRPAMIAAAVATAWTLFLCFNLATIGGPQYRSTTSGGASDLALVPAHAHTSLGAYGFGVWHVSNLLRPVIAWPFARH